MISLCNGWEFTEKWTEEFLEGKGEYQKIRIPHTAKEIPQHYAKPEDYEMLCGYRKVLDVPAEYRGKRLFLQFDGAGHVATVFVNGKELCTHRCGYTSFRTEITDDVSYGASNMICVRLDTSEKNNIPPFGYVIDYLCYGGLYREAWLDVRSSAYIEDIYVTSPTLDLIHVEVKSSGGDESRIAILDGETTVAEGKGFCTDIIMPSTQPWSIENPKLYTCRIQLLSNGEVTDTQSCSFGIRTVEFRSDGFTSTAKRSS
jgi:Beta-galactosidase/beta-glucuronidase